MSQTLLFLFGPAPRSNVNPARTLSRAFLRRSQRRRKGVPFLRTRKTAAQRERGGCTNAMPSTVCRTLRSWQRRRADSSYLTFFVAFTSPSDTLSDAAHCPLSVLTVFFSLFVSLSVLLVCVAARTPPSLSPPSPPILTLSVSAVLFLFSASAPLWRRCSRLLFPAVVLWLPWMLPCVSSQRACGGEWHSLMDVATGECSVFRPMWTGE